MLCEENESTVQKQNTMFEWRCRGLAHMVLGAIHRWSTIEVGVGDSNTLFLLVVTTYTLYAIDLCASAVLSTPTCVYDMFYAFWLQISMCSFSLSDITLDSKFRFANSAVYYVYMYVVHMSVVVFSIRAVCRVLALLLNENHSILILECLFKQNFRIFGK
jgi:hypothetical protein